MSSSKLTWYYPPNAMDEAFREALPCGNGEIGALVCGNIQRERILINHARLWHGGKTMPLPDVSNTLSQVRQLMDKGEMHRANSLLCDALHQKGYDATLSLPQPLVELEARFDYNAPFEKYMRALNMETGEITVTYSVGEKRVSRKLFVSRANGCVVWQIQCNQAMDWQMWLRFPEAENAEAKKMTESLYSSVSITAKENMLFYHCQNDNGMKYGCMLKVVHYSGDDMIVEDRKLFFKGVSQATVILYPFAEKENADKKQRQIYDFLCKQNNSYETYLKQHVALHRPLFRSAILKLGSSRQNHSNEQLLFNGYRGKVDVEILNKLWNFGRYLLISATRENGLPCPLYGLWHTGYQQYWSQNMANVNLQMIYWQTFQNNLMQLFRPVIDYYFAELETYRDNAKKLFGCKGIYIPAGSTPFEACPTQIVPVIMNWTGAAGWLCQSFYQYYCQTHDEEYFQNKILPLMMETAAFYEDFVCYDEKGFIKIYPSVSPENTPGNYIGDGFCENMTHPMPTTVNATMDIAILRELLRNLVEYCEKRQLFTQRVKNWKSILGALPDYRINQDGAIKEWQDDRFDDNYYHRHLSHLYPVFPGYEKRNLSQAELQACCTAVQLRMIDGQTGWSFAYMACIYARLGYAEDAMKSLGCLIRSCLLENFMTTHNDWRAMGMTLDLGRYAPVQLDANMGIVAAINEMLIYSEKGYLSLLPACPVLLDSGELHNFTFPGGLLSMKWNLSQKKLEATITTQKEEKLYVELPKGFYGSEKDKGRSITLTAGVPYTISVNGSVQ